MSLTSYRAAPPRANSLNADCLEPAADPSRSSKRDCQGLRITRQAKQNIMKKEYLNVLGRPGSDLLFHALRQSTIGAEEFNGRVRDGIGCGLLAITTGPAKHIGMNDLSSVSLNMSMRG